MAATSTGVDFTAYPKELTKGTYYVYLVGGGKTFVDSQVASFEYDQKYTLGDVNEDGKVNINDVLSLLNYIAKKGTLSENGLLAADVDRNGVANINDVLKILNYITNKIDTLN